IDASFALIPIARDGKVKTLGITTKERSALAPDIPTIAEQGLAGYDFQSWYGLWAPKGTPREICARINALMRETMAEPAIVQRLHGAADGEALIAPQHDGLREIALKHAAFDAHGPDVALACGPLGRELQMHRADRECELGAGGPSMCHAVHHMPGWRFERDNIA